MLWRGSLGRKTQKWISPCCLPVVGAQWSRQVKQSSSGSRRELLGASSCQKDRTSRASTSASLRCEAFGGSEQMSWSELHFNKSRLAAGLRLDCRRIKKRKSVSKLLIMSSSNSESSSGFPVWIGIASKVSHALVPSTIGLISGYTCYPLPPTDLHEEQSGVWLWSLQITVQCCLLLNDFSIFPWG